MQELSTIDEVRAALEQKRSAGASVGFVATMGALHPGHLSLIRRARLENAVTVVSVFVNPLQFLPGEDVERYPRTMANDRQAAQSEGADFLFVPSAEEMYPAGAIRTNVTVREITRTMEGALRPGHFDGVATVVAKLFAIVGPCRAYFGEKDWQQLVVVRQMVNDLSMPIDLIACETVREPDGLAMSSRNAYLEPQARASAARLSQALFGARNLVASGEHSAAVITDYMFNAITFHNVVVNYADAVDQDLKNLITVGPGARLCVSASVWGTNLIDNVGIPA